MLGEDPKHPGANHYLIHALEASPQPEKAPPAAQLLFGMMPAAGHRSICRLISFSVSGDTKRRRANRSGIAADLAYFKEARPPDYYAMYTAHNYQFLAFAAAMQGGKAATLEAAAKSREIVPDTMLLKSPGHEWACAEQYAARIRFGLWDEILALPAPNPKLLGLTGGWLYATASALAATGNVAEAKAKLGELEKLAAAVGDREAGLNPPRDVLAVAIPVLARIVAAEDKDGEALALLAKQSRTRTVLRTTSRRIGSCHRRHLLGAVLLKGGRADDAEAVYRGDLRRHPDNGWALFGLAETLDVRAEPPKPIMRAARSSEPGRTRTSGLRLPPFEQARAAISVIRGCRLRSFAARRRPKAMARRRCLYKAQMSRTIVGPPPA